MSDMKEPQQQESTATAKAATIMATTKANEVMKEHMLAGFEMYNKWTQLYWEWASHMFSAWNPNSNNNNNHRSIPTITTTTATKH